MAISAPKLVMLDTATLNALAASPRALPQRELLQVFRAGDWIPYVTWHHLEEFFCHANLGVFRARVELLFNLPHLAFIRQGRASPGEPFAGTVLDIRDYEVSLLLKHPSAPYADVISDVWPLARGGFSTGEAFVNENLRWWEFFHAVLAIPTRLRKEEVANLTHFPTTNIKELLPPPGKSGKPLSAQASAKHFARMAEQLAKRVRASGDCRHVDPRAAAHQLMREAYEESLPLVKPGEDFMDAMLRRDGVSRDRLPRAATVEDMGYEAVFVAQMGVNARRLLVSHADLVKAVRREHLPSWVIWEAVDRRMKQMPRAEIGNVNDRYILGFAPYVEVLNVDKRVADLLRQAATGHTLLRAVYDRVPTGRGLAGLIAHLNAFPT